MPAPQRQREASEGSSPLRRHLTRCAVLAGGALAAWLLASGVASATETTAVENTTAPAFSTLGDGGWLLDDPTGTGTPLAQALAEVSAVVAGQPALPELDQLAAPVVLPIEIGLPGELGLPSLPGPGEPPHADPPAEHVRPIILPGGDDQQPHSGQAVAAVPAVAADVAPRPAARTSSVPVDLVAGARPTSAATPEHHEGLPVAPADGPLCFPLSAPPAPPVPTTPAGAVGAVAAVPANAPVSGSTHVCAPRRGPTSTRTTSDQPGTTPD